MILLTRRIVTASLLLIGLSPLVLRAADKAANDKSPFQPNPNWTRVADVSLPSGATALSGTADNSGEIFLGTAVKPGTGYLRSKMFLGDALIHLEYMTGPDTRAGLFLEGRVRVELAGAVLGAKAASIMEPADAASPVAAALVKVPDTAGTWHTLDARFRTPRFDDARNKTQNGLILDLTIDGKLVQSNTLVSGWSAGAEFPWEDPFGPLGILVDKGTLAVRNLRYLRADFEAVKLPAKSGEASNVTKLVDAVKQGEESFRNFGCIECHATQRDDTSLKTGPNLFGLFTLEPRDRQIVSGGEDHRFTIKTDHAYLVRSIRTPQEELAIGEHGPMEGKVYPPAMPPFLPTVLTDSQLEGIGAYLMTLNEPYNQGPASKLVEEKAVQNYDPMTDRLQLLVDQTVRIQRGPMEGVSGRSIHVGLPNAINYTFDPRVLGIAKIWQGGFLDMAGEFLNRGGNGLKPGFESREIELGATGVLLAPLDSAGKPIDFTFKDTKFKDGVAIRESLYSTEDHLARLARIDAQFLGYSRDSRSPDASPVFNYRVGQNTIKASAEFSPDGAVRLVIEGELKTEQSFLIDSQVLGSVRVSVGQLQGDHWVVPAALHGPAVAEGKLNLAPKSWHSKPSNFDYHHQKLVVESSKPNAPAGYATETYLGPKDNYGRDMLFEALGLAVAKDGTLVVATRTAGIWRLRDGQWTQFAEGLFDSLGVQIEDDHGLRVVAGQKAELTRISDTNGDGFADSYETLTDAFSYHGNYHSYMHGPVRDANGDYFITLNLDDAGGVDYEYRAGGRYMGTAGGFRGWMIKVPAKGGFEPWVNGLRSPAGIGFAPDGQLWYTENQGEYVGTSKIFIIKKGAFYGHPAGLVDLPGMTPTSPEIAWDAVKSRKELPVILLPQSRLANSPGNPAWDTTGGKFGPFTGQMLVGDQTQSNLLRIYVEKVGAHEQGVAIPFFTDLESGVMRPLFLPDGSLLLGQTGRGWQAKGGRVASLQHIRWDGKTTPAAMHHVSAVAGGFDVVFTLPVPQAITEAELAPALAVKSWVYRDAPDYGSPELDEHAEPLTGVTLSNDRKTLHIALAKTEQPRIHPEQTARVYQITVDGKKLFNATGPGFDAFYTLYEFPAAKK
ncbi:MAG TPA: family 16 glycoside hydrolase [Opitutaceae bacterium]|nr:family 16 glycoside hydrolase [Opitutaceae bacterium]